MYLFVMCPFVDTGLIGVLNSAGLSGIILLELHGAFVQVAVPETGACLHRDTVGGKLYTMFHGGYRITYLPNSTNRWRSRE